MTETKVTSKYQTTIPDDIRKCLKIDPGSKVEWYMVKGFAIVDKSQKIKNPISFLTSQIKLDFDAVELVKKSREDFK